MEELAFARNTIHPHKGMREDAMGKVGDNNLSISFLFDPHNYNTVKAR